jgi:hypothetical protein
MKVPLIKRRILMPLSYTERFARSTESAVMVVVRHDRDETMLMMSSPAFKFIKTNPAGCRNPPPAEWVPLQWCHGIVEHGL